MLQPWIELVNRLKNPKDAVDIAFVGKYVQQRDSYESLNEALMHGGIANQLKPRLHYIDSEMLETEKIEDLLSGCLLYTSPSPRDAHESRMPSSA